MSLLPRRLRQIRLGVASSNPRSGSHEGGRDDAHPRAGRGSEKCRPMTATPISQDNVVVEAAPPSGKGRGHSRQILRFGLSFVLFAAVIWYVQKNVADFSDVWTEIKAMTPIEISVLAVFAVWNLATYWIVTVITTPGMTYSQAMVQTETTTAVANTVPAGGAVAVGLTYAMLGSWGFSK